MLRIFTDPDCLLHQPPPGFPERGERLERILRHLRQTPFALDERAADVDVWPAVLGVHDQAYLDRFRRASERGDGLLDSADNPLTAKTWDAATAALRVGLTAADWVAAAPDRQAFAAVRPPGHHAESALAMGFCYFNNVAVMAQHLLTHHGLDRVAIVDFDVHHGNGTQHIFEERDDVLFISLHQFPFYPGTGAAAEVGRGRGRGATLNIPLAAGADDQRYALAMTAEVLPALHRFQPQALLVSAGFDAWENDPLGGMRVSVKGFAHWGKLLRTAADELCSGRLAAILEGGYDLENLPRLVEAFLRGTQTAGDGQGAT